MPKKEEGTIRKWQTKEIILCFPCSGQNNAGEKFIVFILGKLLIDRLYCLIKNCLSKIISEGVIIKEVENLLQLRQELVVIVIAEQDQKRSDLGHKIICVKVNINFGLYLAFYEVINM